MNKTKLIAGFVTLAILTLVCPSWAKRKEHACVTRAIDAINHELKSPRRNPNQVFNDFYSLPRSSGEPIVVTADYDRSKPNEVRVNARLVHPYFSRGEINISESYIIPSKSCRVDTDAVKRTVDSVFRRINAKTDEVRKFQQNKNLKNVFKDVDEANWTFYDPPVVDEFKYDRFCFGMAIQEVYNDLRGRNVAFDKLGKNFASIPGQTEKLRFEARPRKQVNDLEPHQLELVVTVPGPKGDTTFTEAFPYKTSGESCLPVSPTEGVTRLIGSVSAHVNQLTVSGIPTESVTQYQSAPFQSK